MLKRTTGPKIRWRTIALVVAAVLVIILIIVLLVLLLPKRSGLLIPEDQETAEGYRLPSHVKPFHYALTLAPFIDSDNPHDFYFTGSVLISIRVLRDTKRFKVHSHKLNVSELRVTNSRGGDIKVASVTEDVAKQWLNVTLKDWLQKDETYTIVIDRFTGELNNSLTGLYYSSYTENGQTKYLVASQLEATYAREVFPCFDEPGLKAEFDVSLVRVEGFSAVSNMPKKEETRLSESTWFKSTLKPRVLFRDDFERTPIMSTYLLAFVVSKFSTRETRDSQGRKFINWLRPGLIDNAALSVILASQTVREFESLLNVPYGMKVTSQAGIPDMKFDAMENWGLILYRENFLAFDDEPFWLYHRPVSFVTIGHEIAHQWFGNLVTMEWWSEVWLNEAFATFYSYLVDHLCWHEPEGSKRCSCIQDMDSTFFISVQILQMKNEDAGQNYPIQRNVSTPTEIGKLFDTLTYLKGGSIIRMMYNTIGDRIFGTGISNYLRKHSYSNVAPEHLYSSLNEQVRKTGQDIDVGLVMSTWVKQAGYPLVTCSRESGSLVLKQQPFGSHQRGTSNLTWIIPVTTMTSLNYSKWDRSQVSYLVQWMSKKSLTLPIDSSKWYLVNLRSSGYYRVNYDKVNWDSLTSQLTRNHSLFAPVDRARLLTDSITLADAGMLDPRVPTDIVRGYLRNEREFAPWLAFRGQFNKLKPALSAAQLKHLMEPVFHHLVEARSKSALDMEVMAFIVAKSCLNNFSYCTEFAFKKCQEVSSKVVNSRFAKHDQKELDPILHTVLCTCLLHGDSTIQQGLKAVQEAPEPIFDFRFCSYTIGLTRLK